jgi:hypothetical protein
MKKILILSLAILYTIIGCSSENPETEMKIPEGTQKIEVVEHLNGGGYTFMKGTETGKDVWIAVREMPVEVGDVYYYASSMEMKNFESKSLNKTFESIFFVDNISKSPQSNGNMGNNSAMPGMASSADGHTKPKVEASAEIKVTPLADGLTVEAVNKDKASLAGKTVKLKGVVTKYNGGIMNRNWLHIQDGTSFSKSIDITVTSDQSAKVGETVIIEGIVTIDKDFGAGYFYDVIIENAKITLESEI